MEALEEKQSIDTQRNLIVARYATDIQELSASIGAYKEFLKAQRGLTEKVKLTHESEVLQHFDPTHISLIFGGKTTLTVKKVRVQIETLKEGREIVRAKIEKKRNKMVIAAHKMGEGSGNYMRLGDVQKALGING